MATNNLFDKFPIVEYNGQSMRNIMLKSVLIQNILNDIRVLYPLTVEDGERPDTVAYDFYGDSQLYWLVLFSNSIVDPYYSWPLSQAEFKSYIIKKYGSIETAMQQILYWKNENFDYFMTPETKSLLANEDKIGWNTPIYAYDHEDNLNEKKRNIVLIDPVYVPQIINELNSIYG